MNVLQGDNHIVHIRNQSSILIDYVAYVEANWLQNQVRYLSEIENHVSTFEFNWLLTFLIELEELGDLKNIKTLFQEPNFRRPDSLLESLKKIKAA